MLTLTIEKAILVIAVLVGIASLFFLLRYQRHGNNKYANIAYGLICCMSILQSIVFILHILIL